MRATFRALKLQILPYFARTHDKIEVNALTCKSKIVFQFNSMVVGWKKSCHGIWITIRLQLYTAEIYFKQIIRCRPNIWNITLQNANNGEPAYVMVFDIGYLPILVVLIQTLLVLLHTSAEWILTPEPITVQAGVTLNTKPWTIKAFKPVKAESRCNAIV